MGRSKAPGRRRRSRRVTARRRPPARRRGRGPPALLSREGLIFLARRTLRLTLFFALPFLLLVRGAVMAHRFLGAPGWVAVAVGAALAATCLSVWGAWLWHRMTGRHRLRPIAARVAIPLVATFCLYSLGWLAHANAKTPSVAARWTDLHPSLRVALGTARLADSEFVITEIARSRADYDRMGLKRLANSLHYEQRDGWVHAVDLRTQGRSEVRNGLARLYFEIMGFDTLRHDGTGDHLHVSLPRS